MSLTLKRKLKFALRFFGAIVLFIFLYAVAVITLSYIPVNAGFVPHDNGGIVIYLRTNGVHTDLVLPIKNDIKDWATLIKTNEPLTDTAFNYAAFGWGDKEFYIETPTWADLKFSTAFKALFFLGNGAMHVTLCKEQRVGKTCKKIQISEESYEKLVHYIDSSFDKKDGQYQKINITTYEDNDLFYEARGKFSLFYSCNTWTNNGLKSSNLKACVWTLFDKPLLSKYN